MEYKVSTRKKDGNWQCTVRYKQGGKWRSKSKQGFKSEKEAERHSWSLLKQVEKIILLDTPEEFENITLERFIDVFIEDNKNDWSPNTHLATANALRYLNPLYSKKITDIKSYELIFLLNDMKGRFAPSTFKSRFLLFKRLFQYAVRPYKILSENPFEDIPLNIKVDRFKPDVLSVAQIDEVIEKMKKTSPPHFHVMIAIAGYAGLRYGEILGLTWNDFNEVQGTIEVNKQWGIVDLKHKSGFRKTKTENSNRTIPIPSRLINIILDYKKSINLDIMPNRMFYKLTSSASNNMNARIKANGYDFTFHTLRHSYATTLVAEGLNLQTVASLVGDDMKTVINTYIHYSDEMRSKAKEQIETLYL